MPRIQKEQAYELKGKYEDALKSAKDESMRIVNQAKDEAKVQAERIVKMQNTQLVQCLTKQRQISGQSRKML